jgi:cbb3-type cytochrome oxidase subunit 1
MMPSATSTQTTSVRLPLQFTVLGLFLFVMAQFLFWFAGPSILNGYIRNPIVLGTVHLFLIGWATMVTMGAMYQLVPVAFQVNIYSEKLGHVQFFLTFVSFFGFLYSLFFIQQEFLLLFGTLLVIAISLFIINLFLSLKRMTNWNRMTSFVLSALLSLTLTIGMGIILVLQQIIGILPYEWYQPLFYTHITLGLVSWFSLLLFGLSYKMVPMFSLAHGFSMELSHVVFYLFHVGIILTILSYFILIPLLFFTGVLLLFLTFILFAYHIQHILSTRMKKNPDLGFRYALFAIGGGVIGHFMFVLWVGIKINEIAIGTQWLLGVVYFTFMSWVTLSILGYLYKIVPFLWWTKKYSNQIGKATVPTLKEMISEKIGHWIFPSFILGTVFVTVSIFSQNLFLFYLGQGIHIVNSIVYITSVLLVFRK